MSKERNSLDASSSDESVWFWHVCALKNGLNGGISVARRLIEGELLQESNEDDE